MNILIISPSSLEEVILSQSLYKTIKFIFPKSNIDIITPILYYSVFIRMPEINCIYINPSPDKKIKEQYLLSRFFRNKNYDQAYILSNTFFSTLIPFFSRIKKRIGIKRNMRYFLLNEIRSIKKRKFSLKIEKYITLAYNQKYTKLFNSFSKPIKVPNIRINKQEKKKILKKFINNNRLIIGICPGLISSIIKIWPYYYYTILINRLIQKGYQIILLGSKKEKKIGVKITQYLSIKNNYYCTNLIGKTSINDNIILLDCCYVIVTNDSLLMHISESLKKSILVIYAPENKHLTTLISNRSKIICPKKYYFNKTQIKKHTFYSHYIRITPDIVLNEIENLVKKKSQK